MSKRQFARSEPQPAGRNLHLVPPPKPKSRPKRRRWKIGRSLKQPYHGIPELLKYEEEIVLAAVAEVGSASVNSLVRRHPERFNRKMLWLTLVRLTKQGRLITSSGLGWLYWSGYTPSTSGTRWWTTPCRPHREFWTKEHAHARRQRTD